MAKKKGDIKFDHNTALWLVFICVAIFALIYIIPSKRELQLSAVAVGIEATSTPKVEVPKPIDKAEYNKILLALSHIPHASTTPEFLSGETVTWKTASTSKLLWPAKIVYPLPGAILPYKRIIAYYGNFYSTKMGVLGEYPEDVMFAKLKAELARWNAADPTTPAIPAINYIAITAQGSAQKDGKYRLRMPDSQVDHAVELAKKVDGIVILDIQVGLSDLPTELPQYEKYFAMPEVHLAIDPEFAMQTSGKKPGSVIGTYDASDINFAIDYLAKLVRDNNLPPKVLIVHRFTHNMVTNYQNIKLVPEVQIVMDMDGWGDPAKKKGTYKQVIYPEPVQFTGFKLFYKNDLFEPSTRMLTPEEILSLTPKPLFIQYQ